ncbi:MAG TPA: hypothetical protein VF784_15760 [Anaerolineales bacterium]
MRVRSAILLFLPTLLLGACSLGKQPTPTAVPTGTSVPLPSVAPTSSTPLAILILPPDMDKATSDAYQSTVYSLAQASGMRFQVRNSLSPQDLEPGLQIVVALPPDPGIAALAAAAPKVQFLAIDLPGVTASGNISVLAVAGQADIPAFVAGFTGAMISSDHRIGMLFPRGDSQARNAAGAFANGMSYYCGLCQPFYYVPYGFPQFQDIPTDEVKSRYPAYADILIVQHKVDTIYLYPGIAVKQLTDYLSTTGTNMIGTSLPDPKPGTWVMTIRPDEQKAVEKAWPDLLAGHGGQSVQSPLGLADIDPSVVSPGKQRLIQQVLDDLLAGRIVTGAAP